MTESLSLPEARRIALAAQGFDRPRPARVDLRHVRGVIRRLGLLQLDYVNVLGYAHHQVLFSRLGSYDRATLDELVYRRREFTEHWAHEASIIPIDTWPLLSYRRAEHRTSPRSFDKFIASNPRYMTSILKRIRDRGALSAAELPAPDPERRRMELARAWMTTVPRAALESYFGRGHLAVAARRPNMARVFDLVERIVPETHRNQRLERDEQWRQLLTMAAGAHGIGLAADLADYYRMPIGQARPRIRELVEAGDLTEIEVEGWPEPAYTSPRVRRPREVKAAALLSPFDPVVWFRPRAARLFGFDYRVELFVPQPKRKWGYYVLPFLLDDRLVARVDLKADRKAGRLLVQAAYKEDGVSDTVVVGPLAGELRTLANWSQLDRIVVQRRRSFERRLSVALKSA